MSCENCEESAYVTDKLAKLLAEIAVIVNGPEPPLTRWSYHDLPEKVRALKQAPPAAAVPAGWREHVEDRIRTWRQSFVNRHGDQLEILDFMGSDSLDDLIDYVCSGQVQPAALAVPEGYALVPVEPTQVMLDAAGMCIVPDGKEWLDQSNRETWAAMLAANKVQP